ncbi:MAG: 1-acyl-sn-glycerol-3-phosphate acyltransferase [Clostridiales bacterium]|nr:1-acyl-sn-glycerol-3-phosphate acyltransferase [Clostridiales bacterium]
MLFYIAFAIIFIPLLITFPIKKVGKKNLKELKGKNFILACNHMSNLDPVMLDITFKKKFRYLAKKELFQKKFASFCLRQFGAVPVDRANPEPKSIKEIFKLLNDGKKVAIFPQGTRAKTVHIEEGSAKEGVAMFSVRTNTPVVPMMFTSKIRAFRRTKLIIGKPIYPDENRKKDKEYITEYSNIIVEKMNHLLEGDKK